MIIYVFINIAITICVLGFDLYRHHFKQLTFNSVLLSIVINAIINSVVIEKFNFITFASIIFFLSWTILQYYLNRKHIYLMISEYKSLAFIFAIMISCSLFITFESSDQSVYMSIPYLAPAIFIIGLSIDFISTFSKNEMNHLKFLSKLQNPIMIGHTIIIISIILLTLLTSFWYIFIIIYALFDVYLLWQLKHNNFENDLKK